MWHQRVRTRNISLSLFAVHLSEARSPTCLSPWTLWLSHLWQPNLRPPWSPPWPLSARPLTPTPPPLCASMWRQIIHQRTMALHPVLDPVKVVWPGEGLTWDKTPAGGNKPAMTQICDAVFLVNVGRLDKTQSDCVEIASRAGLRLKGFMWHCRSKKPPPLHTTADWKVVLHLPEIETWLRATSDRVTQLTHSVGQDSDGRHVDVHLVQLKVNMATSSRHRNSF